METRVNPIQLLKRKAIVKPKKPIFFKIKTTHEKENKLNEDVDHEKIEKRIMDEDIDVDDDEEKTIREVSTLLNPNIDSEYERIVKPKRKFTIKDKRNLVDVNRTLVLERLNQFTNNKVVVQLQKHKKPRDMSEEFKVPIHNTNYYESMAQTGIIAESLESPKKIKMDIVIDENMEDIEKELEKEPEKELEEIEKEPEEEKVEKDVESDIEDAEKRDELQEIADKDIVFEENAEPIIIKKKRGRKPKKGVEKEPGEEEKEPGEKEEPAKKPGKATKKKYPPLIIGNVDIDPTTKIHRKLLINRLPKPEKFVLKTSQYYMNNRKIHVQKLAELFKPYKREILENAEKASCEGTSDVDIKLLTHQKVVRDYLNIYTPYRGLLLYHGLGSGKTCTSIAIAEGMKSNKHIVLMTPASLKDNFFSEIKKCGDHLYRRNQYWEFVSTAGNPEYVSILSKVLQIPLEFIHKHKGAWLVDVTKKEMNYAALESQQKDVLNEQLDLMIRSKYRDINYNGLNQSIMRELTQDYTINPFDNTTVLIDEAHNFVSRIVNKVKSPKSIPFLLYDYLLKANNVKIVFLTGTPIINYPHELGILFNMLRGYIKKWTFQIHVKENKGKVNKDEIMKMFERGGLNTYDYVEYSGNNLVVTRNPFGFVNVKKRAEYKKGGGNENNSSGFFGLFGGKKSTKPTKRKIVVKSNKKTKNKRNKLHKAHKAIENESKYIVNNKTHTLIENPHYKGDDVEDQIEPEARIEYYDRVGQNPYKGGGTVFEDYDGVTLDESGNLNDEDFVKQIKSILQKNHLEVIESGSYYEELKALPDDAEEFKSMFIDQDQSMVINDNLFKKRILGLTSYYKSASEKLLPAFVPTEDGSNIHVVPVEMSDYQFNNYEKIRKIEAEQDRLKNQKKQRMKKKGQTEDIFNISSSYRVFSRVLCNFAFPNPPGRPMPDNGFGGEGENVDVDGDNNGENAIDEVGIDGLSPTLLPEVDDYTSLEDVERLTKTTPEPVEYQARIKNAMKLLKYDPSKTAEEQYLLKENLSVYSPKFAKILENISDAENRGLHLLYSQFRTIEGIGILKLILEANGYAEFKIHKNESGLWDIVTREEDAGKPRFVLYTGTETKEEKEIIRNVYNSTWSAVPSTITAKLYPISNNNYYGEIIKVFMITSSGAEGINLRNTKYVHIVEPYWHMVRTDQVIGRARRICSHQDLPEEDRTVKVFLYLSVFSEEQKTNKKNIEMMNRDVSRIDGRPITTDESLYDISIIKTRINDQLLKSIKETAVDCSLYNSSNKEEKLVCYGFGKVTSNAFGSYPTLGEDLSDRPEINVKKEKLKLKMTQPINGVVYAVNPKTLEAYDLESYQQAKEGVGELVLVGKIEPAGKGFKFIPY
jgi:hypothetical protein